MSRFIAAGVLLLLFQCGLTSSPDASDVNASRCDGKIPWPPGTEVLRFENLDGLILLKATLRGRFAADTTGPLALDTGAPLLAIDLGLARALGLSDGIGEAEAIGVADHPLPRLTLGAWTLEPVERVLTVNAEVVRRVSDRPVLGLLGQGPLADRAVHIDYRAQVLALIPDASDMSETRGTGPRSEPEGDRPADTASVGRSRARLAGVLSPRAIPVAFRLVGDGKILVRGVVADPTPSAPSPPLNLIVDTGATKCVLFEQALETTIRHADRWPSIQGLAAPTLIGTAAARIARIPSIEIETAVGRLREAGVDVGVIRSELSEVLTRVTGETLHGMIGYSFLKRFRVTVDYPERVMWLDRIPGWRDDRPLEYSHVGLQVERHAGAVLVVGVVEGSPADRAEIAAGDEVVAMDGAPARAFDLLDLVRRMEGEPGTPLTLVIRRGAIERTVPLVRRRLL